MDAAAPGVIVLLLYAGYIKESSAFRWVPADLTLMAAGLVIVGVVARLFTQKWVPKEVGPILGLFMVFSPALFWSAQNTSYGADKTGRLFTITLLCGLASVVLISSMRRVWWFLWWTVCFAVLMALLARFDPSTQHLYGRLAAEGSNTIAIGRAVGAGIVCLAGLLLAKRTRWWLAIPVCLFLALSLLGSGSRGPSVGVVAALISLSWLRQGRHRIRDTVLTATFLILAGWWALGRVNSFAVNRLSLLFADDQGDSIQARSAIFAKTLGVTLSTPQGLGWGDLEQVLSPSAKYPHNVLLEVFAEGGWLAGIALLCVMVIAIRRSRVVAPILGLLVFWTVNTFVSGDLNDNRALFALIGVALVAPRLVREAQGSGVAEASGSRRRPSQIPNSPQGTLVKNGNSQNGFGSVKLPSKIQ